jgi:Ca-activated chloride channel family protein
MPAVFLQDDPKPQFEVQVDMVSIDVEVLDDAGNPVTNLQKEDFLVKEDGKPVKITHFAVLRDRRVSLAILLDTSTIKQDKLTISKRFISHIIHLLDRQDDLCFYSFDKKKVYLEADFSTDRIPILRALDNIGVPSRRAGGFLSELFGADPPTGLGIDLSLRSLRDSLHAKKALLVISNRFRGLGPATVEHVQMSGCTLLTLGFDNKSAAIVTMGGDLISKKELMRESGGREFSAETEDIRGTSRAIAASLKNYYSIGYRTNVEPGDKKRRKIEVRIPDREYKINARRSYVPAPR